MLGIDGWQSEGKMPLRIHFASMERTVPGCLIHDKSGIGIDRGSAIEFLGFSLKESEGLTNGELVAKCLAKWRFMCADEMLAASKIKKEQEGDDRKRAD